MSRTTSAGAKRLIVVAWVGLLLLGCGGGGLDGAAPPGGSTTVRAPLQAAFEPGAMVFAVEAAVRHPEMPDVARASFTVRTKPGNLSRDVHVTLERSFLERTGAFDADGTTLRLPVFGLYPSYDNDVRIRLEFVSGPAVESDATVTTEAAPTLMFPITPDVVDVDPDLDFGFFLFQGFRAPAIVDVDGELRWMPTGLGGLVFPRVCVPEGMVIGTNRSSKVYAVDWLGRKTETAIDDPRFTSSHHNLAVGKTGLLNTVGCQDGDIQRPLSVLIEMTPAGAVQHVWDFDEILGARIRDLGEDPAGFIENGMNWFHMNAAIYSPTDDSILVSSREHFVLKADHATGAVRWLLGNPGKDWYRNYPLSLQPLALTVIGDPPIGQHALSLSADGSELMLFNNGFGNSTFPDIGDSRTYSKVSIYRIDEQARTAEEVWSFDPDPTIYSQVCSSAYRTAAGDVVVVFSEPDSEVDASEPGGSAPARFMVVSPDKRVLFEATMPGPGCSVAYAAEEIRLDDLVLR